MSVRDVKARLGSARLVLAQRSVVGDARKAMSNLQAAAVVDLITRVKDALSPVECSDLATFAADICWHTGDLDRVLRELCSQCCPTPVQTSTLPARLQICHTARQCGVVGEAVGHWRQGGQVVTRLECGRISRNANAERADLEVVGEPLDIGS